MKGSASSFMKGTLARWAEEGCIAQFCLFCALPGRRCCTRRTFHRLRLSFCISYLEKDNRSPTLCQDVVSVLTEPIVLGPFQRGCAFKAHIGLVLFRWLQVREFWRGDKKHRSLACQKHAISRRIAVFTERLAKYIYAPDEVEVLDIAVTFNLRSRIEMRVPHMFSE